MVISLKSIIKNVKKKHALQSLIICNQNKPNLPVYTAVSKRPIDQNTRLSHK